MERKPWRRRRRWTVPTEDRHDYELYFIDHDGNQYRVNDVQAFEDVTYGVFDIEELYPNCTVQILKNSITGEMSLGWWQNEK